MNRLRVWFPAFLVSVLVVVFLFQDSRHLRTPVRKTRRVVSAEPKRAVPPFAQESSPRPPVKAVVRTPQPQKLHPVKMQSVPSAPICSGFPATGEALNLEEVLKHHPLLAGHLLRAAEYPGLPGLSAQDRPAQVALVGAFSGPAVRQATTVVDSLGGGIPASGEWRSVLILRQGASGSCVIACDLWSYFAHADVRQDLALTDNDIVYVPVKERSEIQEFRDWQYISFFSQGDMDRSTLLATLGR